MTEGILLDRAPASSFVSPRVTTARQAFTLVELLVVIGIIVVLISILLPVFGRVRRAGYGADTKNWVSELSSAIERYQQDFRAYPGPFGNNDIYNAKFTGGTTFTGGVIYTPVAGSGFDTSMLDQTKITMSENLVLGLLGGLHPDPATPTQLDYDPATVGGGPTSLNTLQPKRYPPYLDPKQLSWRTGANGKTGQFADDSGSAADTIIPEFVDRYPDPMPLLYMRAKVGTAPTGTFTHSYNPIITDDIAENGVDNGGVAAIRAGQYDLSQIFAYTATNNGTNIGVGKSLSASSYLDDNGAGIPANYPQHGLNTVQANDPFSVSQQFSKKYPYDALPYLVGSSGTVKEKDGYILISAGADRVYGTTDDICNFGTVGN